MVMVGAKSDRDYIEYFTTRGFELVKQQLQNRREQNLMFKRMDATFPKDIPVNKFFHDNNVKKLPPSSAFDKLQDLKKEDHLAHKHKNNM